ncbi:hypothetical protein VTL71DRAFT_11492 [Oculimacula yallundae]|uniref:Uncharacterized protein n=1 Tax=Oculimacula yallundae TaxID=86028 RepID=A0ABR4CQQ0_9HELO
MHCIVPRIHDQCFSRRIQRLVGISYLFSKQAAADRVRARAKSMNNACMQAKVYPFPFPIHGTPIIQHTQQRKMPTPGRQRSQPKFTL